MVKKTVYMDEDTYRRLKQLARKDRRPAAEMIREAVAEYTIRHGKQRKPRCIGAFKSGRADLGQRADELLTGFGKHR
jgi:predicted transcriptional regulator